MRFSTNEKTTVCFVFLFCLFPFYQLFSLYSLGNFFVVIFTLYHHVFLSPLFLVLFPYSLHLLHSDVLSVTLISIHLFLSIFYYFFPFILPILFTKFTKSIPPCFCYFKLQFSSAVNFSPSQLHTEVCFLSHCRKACPSYSFPLHNFNFVHRRKNKIVIGWHSSLNEKGYFRSCWCLVINKESLLCKYLSVVQLNSNRRYFNYKSKNSFSCGGSGVLGHT